MLEELEIASGLLVKYRGQAEHVIIPKNVTSIRENALSDCKSIKKVTFLAPVQTIGEFAFNNCDALEEVHVPSLQMWFDIDFQGFRANPLSNGARLFVDAGCESEGEAAEDGRGQNGGESCVGGGEVVHAVIPEGVIQVPQRVFEGCTSLESVEIPSTVRSIGKLAFGACPALKDVRLAESDAGGLEEIGYSAFRGCAALTTFAFPPSLKSICSWAFAQCTALSAVVLPEGLMSLERDAFYGCSSIGFVRLPSTLNALVDDVFYGCSALESVRIPAGVDAFGSNVFTGCTRIREVWLEGRSIPESFVPPASLEVLIMPDGSFDGQVRPSLQLPLAAGFVKLAAAGSVSLSPACADFVRARVSDILQSLRFESASVKWLVNGGFIPCGEEAAYAAQASSFEQPEAAAVLLECATAASFSGFDSLDLEL